MGPPSRSSIVPGAPALADAPLLPLEKGAIRNAITAEELLALPVAKPLTREDLDPISIPVLLLRVLGVPNREGTLRLMFDGGGSIDVAIMSGRAMLNQAERTALIHSFSRPTGRYTFDADPPDVVKRKPHRMLAIVAEGFRSTVRGFDLESIVASFGDRAVKAPLVIPSQRIAVSRLFTADLETRIIDNNLDGKRSVHDLVATLGPVRRTALQLLLLLTLFELIDFREPEKKKVLSPREQLEARFNSLEKANHFEVLGLHWSALSQEIEAAHAKLSEEFSEEGDAQQSAPAVVKKLRRLVDVAYEVLRDDEQRKVYRTEAYPKLDMRAVKDLLEQKRRALSLREDSRPLREVQETIRDVGGKTKKRGRP